MKTLYRLVEHLDPASNGIFIRIDEVKVNSDHEQDKALQVPNTFRTKEAARSEFRKLTSLD